MELKEYQRETVRFLLQRNGNALVALDMGLGKTLCAITYINSVEENPFPCVIVCPATLKFLWEDQIKTHINSKWYDGVNVFTGKNFDLSKSIFIINYDNLDKYKKVLVGIKTIIFDEAGALKSYKSKRTKAAIAITKDIPHKIFMNGTPLQDRPRDIFPIFKMLLGMFPSSEHWYLGDWFHFTKRFCGGYFQEITVKGWKKIKVYNDSGATNKDQLSELLKKIMIRRLKKDVLPELPQKSKIIIPIEDSDEAVEQDFQARIDQAKATDTDLGDQRIPAAAIVEEYRKYAINKKLPESIKFVSEICENEKCVVGAHHKEAIIQLKIGLAQYNPLVITGDTPVDERFAIVKSFQEDPKHKVIICSIKAAGVGLTLTAASKLVVCEPTWTPSDLFQFEDRIHRISQEDNVEIYYLTLRNSIDMAMFKLLTEKQETISHIVDNNKQGFFK